MAPHMARSTTPRVCEAKKVRKERWSSRSSKMATASWKPVVVRNTLAFANNPWACPAQLHISLAALNLVDYVYLRAFTSRSTLTRQNASDFCWIGHTNAFPHERKIILGVLVIRDRDIHKLR